MMQFADPLRRPDSQVTAAVAWTQEILAKV